MRQIHKLALSSLTIIFILKSGIIPELDISGPQLFGGATAIHDLILGDRLIGDRLMVELKKDSVLKLPNGKTLRDVFNEHNNVADPRKKQETANIFNIVTQFYGQFMASSCRVGMLADSGRAWFVCIKEVPPHKPDSPGTVQLFISDVVLATDVWPDRPTLSMCIHYLLQQDSNLVPHMTRNDNNPTRPIDTKENTATTFTYTDNVETNMMVAVSGVSIRSLDAFTLIRHSATSGGSLGNGVFRLDLPNGERMTLKLRHITNDMVHDEILNEISVYQHLHCLSLHRAITPTILYHGYIGKWCALGYTYVEGTVYLTFEEMSGAQPGAPLLCLKALKEFHALTGIEHGDVQPFNFVVQQTRAVLIDFGLSTIASDESCLQQEVADLEELIYLLDNSHDSSSD
jgi:hypothetical protein